MDRREVVLEVSEKLKIEIAEKKYVKINGIAPAKRYGVDQKIFRQAVKILTDENYVTHLVAIFPEDPSRTEKMLCLPDITREDIMKDLNP